MKIKADIDFTVADDQNHVIATLNLRLPFAPLMAVMSRLYALYTSLKGHPAGQQALYIGKADE